ncbi:cytochrome P450 [Amycolatopsis sp. H20-H5]|uniref:cytochrome P450 n=1 Tax=Amycolatopsis sp. H20-H5 TaxID=3046309 RepID=UPI002DB82EDC|nr:cytochrome P450 [Amycolatopsis sp. H20-H5]MEC3976286.1 cytochrome P450 [Amycolatopsis sp. H20-H5]
MTTTLADTWGIHQQQFWLRGQVPDQPVRFDEKTGMWNVYGYPEVLTMLSDPKTYGSDLSRVLPEGMVPGMEERSEGNILQMDPPDHTKLRQLVSHAFTPKVVADLEPRIAELTHELLDQAGPEPELVADLAYPLPVIVIAELLGVPSSDRHLFKEWVDKMLESSTEFSLVEQNEEQKKVMEAALEPQKALTEYLREHAAERRGHPREDLLSKLVEAEVDGAKLSLNEVTNFANILLLAGHITTTMLLGNTVLCLDTHPDEFAKVRADRSTLPAVIEESLRFLTPFAVLARATTAEVELGGATIPADQMLMVWVAAANRDARHFAHPDVFDPSRKPNAHLAFGRGIHFCIGAPLARLEGRVALDILLDRYPSLRTDPARPPEFIPSPNMTGVRKLPLLTT